MPLFQCEKCGCVENTACCGYWGRNRPSLTHKKDLGKKLCCACESTTYPSGEAKDRGGRWHNEFDRIFLPLGEWGMNSATGNLIHLTTGETDYSEHILKRIEVPKAMPEL